MGPRFHEVGMKVLPSADSRTFRMRSIEIFIKTLATKQLATTLLAHLYVNALATVRTYLTNSFCCGTLDQAVRNF